MKKILIVADRKEQYEIFKSQKIEKILHKFDSYDVEVKVVLDDGAFRNGDSWSGVKLKLEQEGPEWVEHYDEFLEEVKDANIIVMHYSAADSVLINTAKDLEMIAVMRSGVENINIPLCKEKNITVCNAPGRSSEEVADMTLALILSLNRNIQQNDLTTHKGFNMNYPQNPELVKDLVIGLVGFGDIARRVSKKLSSMDCVIIAYDPFVSQKIADDFNVKLVSLEEVMSQADVISLHTRLMPSTENIINKEMISLMKPTAMFVNTARAGLVDEDALIKALNNKKIRSAALDVYKEEPLPDDHILRSFDNVILTPHIAGNINDGLRISLDLITDEVERYLKGDELKNIVK